jgi:hypothetical protein
MALHHHVEHAHIFVGELVLLQEGHALAGLSRETLPAEWLQHAGQDLHEGGLAGEPLAPIRP